MLGLAIYQVIDSSHIFFLAGVSDIMKKWLDKTGIRYFQLETVCFFRNFANPSMSTPMPMPNGSFGFYSLS